MADLELASTAAAHHAQTPARTPAARWSLAFRLAGRDLRGGLAGLRLLFLCLFLGVTALAAVGSLSSAIVAGLAERGQAILGGDIQATVSQRVATPEEQARLEALGDVSAVTRTRAMAARLDGAESMLVELKGVDRAYPLFGSLRLAPGALAPRPSGLQVAAAPEVAERLGIGIGDRLRLGNAELTLIGFIAEEPDRVGQGFTLGPSVLIDEQGLAATGLIQPGSQISTSYRIRLAPGLSTEAVREALTDQLGEAGYRIQDSSNGAPGVRRFVERMGQFLTLVGLAALLIAGVGVGSGVTSYLEGKRGGIATLKMLGADGPLIFRSYLAQIAVVAFAAVLLGLAVGAAVPWLVVAAAGDALPAPPRLSVYPLPLLVSAAYGLLIAFAFAIVPLAQARSVPAASLYRGALEGLRRPGWRVALLVAAAMAALVALAVATAREPVFSAVFFAVAFALLALLAGIGWLIRRGAAALPRPKEPTLRLAIASLHRPGAHTGRLVVALGLGLTLFTTMAVIETNLAREIRTTVPEKAPSFFLLDIPASQADRFRALASDGGPEGEVVLVPSLRGSVVKIGDTRVADLAELPDDAWWLRGDRGLTFLQDLPQGNRVVAGQWWPENYRGPPLVSLDVEAATSVGLEVGDTITVSILGREVEARIASLREINWDTMGFNFVVVFAPGALESAPHSVMATVAMPEAQERPFQRAVAQAFPTVTLIRVKEVVDTVAGLLGQLSVAIRAAASVAILAGIAVLVGAIAASRRARIYDSVVLKLLGATRWRILLMQAIEYGVLATILCTLALALGAAAGWYVIVQVFELQWGPHWPTVAATLGLGALVTIGLGLLGALPALAARPARALRTL